jgi:hypothetical protein
MTSRRPGCAGWGLPRLPIDRKTGQDILTNVPGIRVHTTNDEQDRGSGQRNNQREMQRMTHAPSRQKYRAASRPSQHRRWSRLNLRPVVLRRAGARSRVLPLRDLVLLPLRDHAQDRACRRPLRGCPWPACRACAGADEPGRGVKSRYALVSLLRLEGVSRSFSVGLGVDSSESVDFDRRLHRASLISFGSS